MKKRKGISIFIISMLATIIAQGIGIFISLKLVYPTCGWLVAGIGMFALPVVIYLVIYSLLIHFLNKNH